MMRSFYFFCIVCALLFFIVACNRDAQESTAALPQKEEAISLTQSDDKNEKGKSAEPAAANEKDKSTEPAAANEKDKSTEPAAANEKDKSAEPAAVNEKDKSAEPAAATEAPASPEPAPVAPALDLTSPEAGIVPKTADGIQIAELIVARGIEDRKPLDPRNIYTLGEFDRIVAYISLQNPNEVEGELHVSFLNIATGKEQGKVTINVVPKKKWVTWAFTKTISTTGQWAILVRDANENILSRVPFEIVAPK